MHRAKEWLALLIMVLSSIGHTERPIETLPGVAMLGGCEIPENAMKWLVKRCNGGDFVALTFSDNQDEIFIQRFTKYIKELNVPIRSLEIIPIGSKEQADSIVIANKIRNAEGIFISGGNQSNYIKYWKNTLVAQALNDASKKVSIGGTSAGLAILGEFYYSANAGGVHSTEALADPYNEFMSDLGSEFLKIPFLANIITDSHYSERSRQGRHATFIARLMKDLGLKDIKGIGIDEDTALCIDEKGNATVFGKGKAFFIKSNTQPICMPKKALSWIGIRVYVIRGDNDGKNRFSMNDWEGQGGNWVTWSISDGKLEELADK